MTRTLLSMCPHLPRVAATALIFVALFGTARAEDHTAAARKHAAEAATATDSMAISHHTAEALKHVEAAKAVHADKPHVLKHIEKGEAELKHANNHAHWFNTHSAADHAEDGRAHLEAAEK